MKAKTTAQDDQYIGVDVTDRNGVVHDFTIEKTTGEIEYQSQDGYPDDPNLRTDEEKIAIQQAANFARYHVYRERGHETIDRHRNPDRLALAALIVESLSTEAFEEYFGDLYQQLESEYTDQEPVVEVHEALQDDDAFMLYAKELYLGFDDGMLEELVGAQSADAVDAYLEDIAQLTADAQAGTAGVFDDLDTLIEEHDVGTDTATDAAAWVDAVSGVHVQWRVGEDLHREENDSPDLDRGPDAIVEIIPHEPDSIESFQAYVVQHLKCQIRDQLVEMGITPPEPFQVQGPGADISTMIQQHYDGLQHYHDPDATIDWEAV